MRSDSRALGLFCLLVSGAAGLAGCATPADKAACFPVPGWSTPVMRCQVAPAASAPIAEPAPLEPPPPAEPPPPTATMGGETIELSETVQFETGSAVLIDRSKTLLDDVARTLQANPDVTRVQIEGHTDAVASDRTNMKLSQDRVNAVKQYLVGAGVEAKRLATKAFGKRKPIADNTTEEGRAKNRRVEFRILKRK